MPVSGLRSAGGELPALRSHPGGLRPQPVSGLEMRDCRAMGINFAHASFANRITAKSYFCEGPLTGNNFQLRQLRKLPAGAVRACRQPLAGANLLGASLAGSDLQRLEFRANRLDQLQPAGLRSAPVRSTRSGSAPVNLAGVQINEDQQQGCWSRSGWWSSRAGVEKR